jgi:hypothetical protein
MGRWANGVIVGFIGFYPKYDVMHIENVTFSLRA